MSHVGSVFVSYCALLDGFLNFTDAIFLSCHDCLLSFWREMRITISVRASGARSIVSQERDRRADTLFSKSFAYSAGTEPYEKLGQHLRQTPSKSTPFDRP